MDGLELAVEYMDEGVAHLFKCAGNIFSTAFLNLTIFPKVVNPSLGKTVSSSLFLRSRIQLWPSMSSAVKQKLAISIEDKRSDLPSTYHNYHRRNVLGL